MLTDYLPIVVLARSRSCSRVASLVVIVAASGRTARTP